MRTCAHAYSKQTHKQTDHNDRVCHSVEKYPQSWKVEKRSRIHSCRLLEKTQAALASVSSNSPMEEVCVLVVKCVTEDLQNKNKEGSQEPVLSVWACVRVDVSCVARIERLPPVLQLYAHYTGGPGWLASYSPPARSKHTHGKAERHCCTQQQLTRLLSPRKHSSAGLCVTEQGGPLYQLHSRGKQRVQSRKKQKLLPGQSHTGCLLGENSAQKVRLDCILQQQLTNGYFVIFFELNRDEVRLYISCSFPFRCLKPLLTLKTCWYQSGSHCVTVTLTCIENEKWLYKNLFYFSMWYWGKGLNLKFTVSYELLLYFFWMAIKSF